MAPSFAHRYCGDMVYNRGCVHRVYLTTRHDIPLKKCGTVILVSKGLRVTNILGSGGCKSTIIMYGSVVWFLGLSRGIGSHI